jgi:class 3 adenylate cyclase
VKQSPTAPGSPRFALADLAQDIAGDLPRDLILRWNDSDRDPAFHDELLAPFLVEGTIVSTDSAGLSSLTQRLPLASVLKLVSEPKEILHALAKAIDGEAIGTWIADNSQLFFPARVQPSTVMDQLFEAQRRIASRTVQVGIGVHVGACYKLADGLYGEHADLIEHVAEEVTRGGEILITESTYAALEARHQRLAVPCELGRSQIPLRSITRFGSSGPHIDGDDDRYPAPFSQDFWRMLKSHTSPELERMPFSDLRRSGTVVFVKATPPARARLLDAFTELAIVDAVVRRDCERKGATLIKSNGAIAIALFDATDAAVNFAIELDEALSANAPDARIALAHGEVFVFELDREPHEGHFAREIAGDPVNIASKLAEDSGLGGVLVDRSVSLPSLPSSLLAERYSHRVGSLELEGARITRR